MKEVYKEVGLMHSKAPANVEKSIRLALNKALQSNPEAFQNLCKRNDEKRKAAGSGQQNLRRI